MDMAIFLSTEIKHLKAKKIALGIIIALIILAAFVSDRFISANTFYARAVHMEETGYIDAAKNGYIQTLQMNPWHADANYQLGVLMGKQGNTSEAIKYINRALQSKDDPDYYLGLGFLYLNKLQDTKNAEKNFREAYVLDPHNYFACNMLGILAEHKHDSEQAIRYYKKAIQTNPGMSVSYKKLASIYAVKGMDEKAEDCWQNVLKIDPKDKDAKAYFKVSKSAN